MGRTSSATAAAAPRVFLPRVASRPPTRWTRAPTLPSPFFAHPCGGAAPSYSRALEPAVLPSHSLGVQAWWQAADLEEVRLIPSGLSSGATLSKWPPWPGELILGPELPAVRGRRWIRAGALRGPRKHFVSVCESPLRHFPAYSTNRGRPAERRRFDVKSRFDAIAERAATRWPP